MSDLAISIVHFVSLTFGLVSARPEIGSSSLPFPFLNLSSSVRLFATLVTILLSLWYLYPASLIKLILLVIKFWFHFASYLDLSVSKSLFQVDLLWTRLRLQSHRSSELCQMVDLQVWSGFQPRYCLRIHFLNFRFSYTFAFGIFQPICYFS